MYQEVQSKKQDWVGSPPALKRATLQRQPAAAEEWSLTAAETPEEPGRTMDDIRIFYRSGRNPSPRAEADLQESFAPAVNASRLPLMRENREERVRGSGPSAPVVQRIIQGEGDTKGLEKLLAAYAARFPGSTFSRLFSTLHGHPETIRLMSTDGVSSYEPAGKKLYFKLTLFRQLHAALQDPEGDRQVISSLLANICHELSHAHDFLGDGTNTPKETLTDGTMSDETFISTEFRAWTREAISILEVNRQSGLAHNDSNRELIEGWENLNPDMLDNLAINKITNLIIKRFVQYIVKRKHFNEVREAQEWIADPTRNARFKEQLARLRASVLAKKESLYKQQAEEQTSSGT